MFFRFDVKKAIQAAAVLLRFEPPQQMSYLRLLKLLYIADRQSLKESGRPILGSRVVAMDHGPLHSEVFDLIKGQHLDEPAWSEFIRKDGYRIELIKDPGVSELSRSEIARLQDISAQYAEYTDWEVSTLTHSFEEWSQNYRPKTSRPIRFEDVIDAVGRTADKESILQDARDTMVYDRVFGG